jgi:hypothetical protein
MTSSFSDANVSEMRRVARRQLTGSIVAAMMVVAVASLVSLRSTHYSPGVRTTAHSSVQQPVFVSPSDHMVASVKRKIETP